MDKIVGLTRLAYQYAPFFFAVYFNMYITRWAHKIYTQEKDSQKIRTYRLYFLGTTAFGMLLVVASIVWWWANPSVVTHIFKGEIKSLKDYERITSNTLYFKPVLVPPLEEEAPQIRHEHFIISQQKPFSESDEFEIFYAKGEGKMEECCLKYTSHLKPKFKIEWDPNLEKVVLKDISSPIASKATLPLMNEAYAEITDNPSRAGKPLQVAQNQPSSDYLPDRKIIDLLQNERTDVGTKIAALDRLNALNDENLKKYVEVSTYKEPMVLTLLDLTRHTDKELAYKATKIINKRIDVCSFLSQRLLSADQRTRDETVEIFYRIEPERAQEALRRLPTNIQAAWLPKLKEDIQSGEKSKVLIPTGSTGGDRYYVRADWDPQNEETVRGLTYLFNKSLISNRTLDEESLIMKDRSHRWVYWYSKEWALEMAKKIEECRAKASLVAGFSSK